MPDTDRIIDSILSDLIEVPAGVTVIGSTPERVEAELARPDMAQLQRGWLLKEIPRHRVTVGAFAIARLPLTVAQVRGLSGLTGVDVVRDEPRDDHPATVGADAAFTLCARLGDELGRQVSLPTEQQWVRAARGDDERRYPWGDDWRPEAANMAHSGIGHPLPVGSFPRGASAYGLLDMAGNADELTSSRYAPFDGAPDEVPDTESWAYTPFVTKGGGFMHAEDLARVDRRHGVYEIGEPLAVRLVIAAD